MPLTRRYTPTHSALDSVLIGYDFSTVLPPGVGIAYPGQDFSESASPTEPGEILPTPRLEIWANFATPVPSPEDWYVDPRLAPVTPWGDSAVVDGVTKYGLWYWVLDENPLTGGGVEWAQWPVGAPPPVSTPEQPIGVLNLGTKVVGRRVYSIVSGGDPGVDYQFRWFITDTFGNRWTRTGLLLVGLTS